MADDHLLPAHRGIGSEPTPVFFAKDHQLPPAFDAPVKVVEKEGDATRLKRRTVILEQTAVALDQLTDDEFARLSANGHDAWLESLIKAAIHRVAGCSKQASSSIGKGI